MMMSLNSNTRASMVPSPGNNHATWLQPPRRPVIKPLLTGMPFVDLSCLDDRTTRLLTVREIGEACRLGGCFQVVNHGIDEAVLGGAMEAARQFFELEEEEREKLASEDLNKPVRFSSARGRSMLRQYSHPLRDWIQYWPSNPPTYREKMGNYTIQARRVALKVLGAILESLGLGESYLKRELEEGLQLVAVNCYPKFTCKNSAIGASTHTDPGYITVLLQSCEGLQVMDREGQGWKSVPVNCGSLHIQVGDYLEVLSNGRYKSLMHRVMLNQQKDRISIASIQNLAMGGKVATAAELVDEDHPVGYRECSFRDVLDYHSSEDLRQQSFLDSLRIERK